MPGQNGNMFSNHSDTFLNSGIGGNQDVPSGSLWCGQTLPLRQGLPLSMTHYIATSVGCSVEEEGEELHYVYTTSKGL